MSSFTHENGTCFEVDDAELYAETIGDPAGEPVVLLHGGFGTLMDFNPLLRHLPKGLCLTGIDLRGHGRSTLGGQPLTYARHQSDVDAVLERLGIHDAVMLGFSDGGIVAYRMAAAHSQACRGVLTIGAQWRMEEGDPSLPLLQGFTRQDWESIYPESVPYYERVNPEPDFDVLFQAVTALWLDAGPTGYPGASVEAITIPTLIVRGGQDPLFPLSEAVSLLDRLPHAEFLNVPFAGHAVHEDAPEMLASAFRSFLDNMRKT